MNKMSMPELDVVKFKELDVIVASNGFYTLSKTGDGTGWNMRFTDPNGAYIVKNTQVGSVNYDGQFGPSDQLTFHNNAGSNLSLFSLINMDSSNVPTPTNGFDGDYVYDSETNSFSRRQ